MRVRLAFGNWAEEPGAAMPNVIACSDEYMEDEWNGLPDFYQAEVEKHRKGGGEVREVFVEVDDAIVESLFAIPTVAAAVAAGGQTEGEHGPAD